MMILLFISYLAASTEFYNNSKLHLTLSSSCIIGNNWTKCKAIQPLQKIIHHSYINGIENGSAICGKLRNAKIKYLLDKKRNMRSVCQFDDQSWVDLGTLDYFAAHKKILPKNP